MLKANYTPFPHLTTERLLLRQVKIEDANEIFALRSDEQVNKFLDRPKCDSVDDALKFINTINSGISNNEVLYWAIVLKNDPTLIGTICYWNFSKENFRAEIGFELNPEFQGKGIVMEALAKVIQFGFENLKLQSIEACTCAGNHKSIRVLEKNNFNKKMDAGNKKDIEKEGMNTEIYSLTNETYFYSLRSSTSA